MTTYRTQFESLIARREELWKVYDASNWATFDQAKWDALDDVEQELAEIANQLDIIMTVEDRRLCQAASF